MEIIYETEQAKTAPCVATIGFFDGVHTGHHFLIEQVKQEAARRGLHSALVTFPVHPRKVMQASYQPRLLSTRTEKETLLSQTGADYCFMLGFTVEISRFTAYEFMRDILKQKMNVQVLVIGYDHRFGRDRSEGFDDYRRFGKELGIEVVLARECRADGIHISSSAIRQFLQEGNITLANRCLGYEYSLEGVVVDGHKVGRTLGFPTANLRVEERDKLLPADGVYAVRVRTGGREYMGMMDIGHRPTVDNGGEKSVEVNILDFSSDLYGQTIRVSFVQWIRRDIKFPGLQGLIARLREDEAEVRRIFGKA